MLKGRYSWTVAQRREVKQRLDGFKEATGHSLCNPGHTEFGMLRFLATGEMAGAVTIIVSGMDRWDDTSKIRDFILDKNGNAVVSNIYSYANSTYSFAYFPFGYPVVNVETPEHVNYLSELLSRRIRRQTGAEITDAMISGEIAVIENVLKEHYIFHRDTLQQVMEDYRQRSAMEMAERERQRNMRELTIDEMVDGGWEVVIQPIHYNATDKRVQRLKSHDAAEVYRMARTAMVEDGAVLSVYSRGDFITVCMGVADELLGIDTQPAATVDAKPTVRFLND